MFTQCSNELQGTSDFDLLGGRRENEWDATRLLWKWGWILMSSTQHCWALQSIPNLLNVSLKTQESRQRTITSVYYRELSNFNSFFCLLACVLPFYQKVVNTHITPKELFFNRLNNMHGHIHGVEYNIIYNTMYIIHTLFVPVRKLNSHV